MLKNLYLSGSSKGGLSVCAALSVVGAWNATTLLGAGIFGVVAIVCAGLMIFAKDHDGWP